MNSLLQAILLAIVSVILTAPANAAVLVDLNSNCDVVADASEGGKKDVEEEPDCD
jgi:hypothetical protein